MQGSVQNIVHTLNNQGINGNDGVNKKWRYRIFFSIVNLLYFLFLIPIITDDTDYEYPLKYWLVGYLCFINIFFIFRVIRWFITDETKKKILFRINLAFSAAYVIWIILGTVGYGLEQEDGPIKRIILTLCIISYCLWFLLWCCISLLACLLFANAHLEDPDSPINPATVEAIEEFTNLHIYSDFFKSNKDKYNETECTICKEDYVKDDKIRKLSCEHYFHAKCITKWLQINKTCPYCRKPIDEIIQTV